MAMILFLTELFNRICSGCKFAPTPTKIGVNRVGQTSRTYFASLCLDHLVVQARHNELCQHTSMDIYDPRSLVLALCDNSTGRASAVNAGGFKCQYRSLLNISILPHSLKISVSKFMTYVNKDIIRRNVLDTQQGSYSRKQPYICDSGDKDLDLKCCRYA